MRTILSYQNNRDERRSVDNQCIYGLGINRKTGRLQWCPDCNLCKISAAIAGIMIPIVVMMILLAKIDGSLSSFMEHYSTTKHEMNELISTKANGSNRCTAIRFRIPDIAENGEKDVLRDVTTSYVPSNFVIIPPDCNIQIQNRSKHGISQNDPYYLDSAYRLRRNAIKNQTMDNLNKFSAKKLEITITRNNKKISLIANNDAHDAKSENPSDELLLSNSFWTIKGTKEGIRNMQAKVMSKYMDQSVDPCVDFYQYACGNWGKLNPIPKDKAGYDTFEMLRENLDLVLKDLLSDEHEINNWNIENSLDHVKSDGEMISETDASEIPHFHSKFRRQRHLPKLPNKVRRNDVYLDAEQKAKDLYSSCMNYDILVERGVKPLLDLLQKLGGWPVLDLNWTNRGFDWLSLTAQLRTFNNDIFIVQWVGPDIQNSEENIIQFDQTTLGLPTRDYFLEESNSIYLDAYRKFMETIMHLLGAEADEAADTSIQLIDFETQLAQIIIPSEERVNVSLLYKRMTIHELSQKVPGINWVNYLEIVQEREVKESESIVIYAISYMRNLVKLISRTEPRTIANYLLWRFVRHRINNLDDRFSDAKQNFFHALFGREKSPQRWKNCVGQVNTNMGMSLGAMFVRRYFSEISKKDTLQMTNAIQDAFREILNETDWLDAFTRKLAIEKVNSMSLKIGYPDFILDHAALNKKYEGLRINPNRYFENTLNLLRYVTKAEQDKLTKPVNKTLWQTAPAVVNAYYSRNKNQIMFPAGILQPPFYHRYFPRSLNFGGIGVVIGHELTHGFDDKGRLFDRNGNIHKWWSDFATEEFHERSSCLIFQYGNYTVSEVGIAVDGESTQGENIADNGGIRQAFHAYKKWLRKNNNPAILANERLPGINLTNTQLFFLNFAQVWCGTMRPEATRNKLKTAVHSPGRFRVIGTLSNSKDFGREFNCPLGAPMNPINKCSVW